MALFFFREAFSNSHLYPGRGVYKPWEELCARPKGPPPPGPPWLLFIGIFVLLWYIADNWKATFLGNLKLPG